MNISTHDFDSTEFEANVYARFPEDMHDYVEEALFYNGAELQSGEMTFREFAHSVSCHAVMRKQEEARVLQADIMFEGVRQLVLEGKIDDPEIVEELTEELQQGADGLLARFIYMQTLTSPLDAAVSYLAWKRARALIKLEDTFGVNLDMFRDTREPEFFCTSEGNMALVSFSVMSE